MILNHKPVPDVIAVEYLRGYLAGLTMARRELHLTPYDRLSERIEQISDEINEIETRLK